MLVIYSVNVCWLHFEESINVAESSIARHCCPLSLSIFCCHLKSQLESRRAQLTERFFWRSVLCEASCLHYLLLEERVSSVTDVCTIPRLFNTSQPELINFRILLSHIACDITISLGLV